MTLKRVAIPSPNYSSRGGARVTTIVVHTAEGALTYQSLGSFFANPASGVSSHVGIDDTPATVGEYVRRDGKAWTQGNANPWCVSAELCAFAAWDAAEWDRHPAMLANCAAWIAEEAAHFAIPLRALTPADAQAGLAGVCQHVDLGAMGGGHTDCGPAFPMAAVLAAAGAPGGTTPTPTPPPASSAAPPYPGRPLVDLTVSDAALVWQAQMAVRGWDIVADGAYGPASASVCEQFQAEKGLAVDGIVGPDTWAATWAAPVT
jgi:hypothetical protein